MKASAQIRLAAPARPRGAAGRAAGADHRDGGERLRPYHSGAVLARRPPAGWARWCWRIARCRPILRKPPRLWRDALATRLDTLDWTDAARQLQARVALLHALEPEVWPDLSQAGLAAERAGLAGRRICSGRRSWRRRRKLDLHAILRGPARLGSWRAGWTRELPTHLALPGGAGGGWTTPHPVPVASARGAALLRAGGDAAAGARAGEAAARAAVAGGGVPSPSPPDLAGFWRGAWADVRRDMRGPLPRATTGRSIRHSRYGVETYAARMT